jgi:hypothetical protein
VLPGSEPINPKSWRRPELQTDEVTATLERLMERITERFPKSGLSKVCADLIEISRDTREVAAWILKPNMVLRVGITVFLVVVSFTLFYSLSKLKLSFASPSVQDLVGVLNSATNEIILLSAGVFSLIAIENRIKRERVIDAISNLRAVAHIIDMHQLTKAPGSKTHGLSDEQLSRYLDYCSEMLSLVSKIAFLYVNNFDDAPANQSVNELEDLTSGLSRKIWQKITIIAEQTKFSGR